MQLNRRSQTGELFGIEAAIYGQDGASSVVVLGEKHDGFGDVDRLAHASHWEHCLYSFDWVSSALDSILQYVRPNGSRRHSVNADALSSVVQCS